MHDRPTGDATPTDREAERLSTKSDTAERLITSVLLQRQLCRNRKCADIFAANVVKGTPKEWATIETEELNGQKLQGTGTSEDVMKCLEAKGVQKDFPLFTKIFEIAFKGAAPKELIEIGATTKYY